MCFIFIGMRKSRRRIQSVYLHVKRWQEKFGLVAIYLNPIASVGKYILTKLASVALGLKNKNINITVVCTTGPFCKDEKILCSACHWALGRRLVWLRKWISWKCKQLFVTSNNLMGEHRSIRNTNCCSSADWLRCQKTSQVKK